MLSLNKLMLPVKETSREKTGPAEVWTDNKDEWLHWNIRTPLWPLEMHIAKLHLVCRLLLKNWMGLIRILAFIDLAWYHVRFSHYDHHCLKKGNTVVVWTILSAHSKKVLCSNLRRGHDLCVECACSPHLCDLCGFLPQSKDLYFVGLV